jgi:putative Mg2+ transporter-C (MgtC) family protein
MEYFNLEFFIRLTAASMLGFALGLERELTNKYAGLRTHILVCLGACVFTLLSIYGFPTFADGDNVVVEQATGVRDTARIAAQIVTGIGFIGAGTVLRNGPMVFGLTTAATLWIAASIGMACGAGMYDIAFAGTLLAISTLVIIRIFERNVLPSSTKRTRMMKVSITCNTDYVQDVQDFIVEKFSDISELKKRLLSAEGNVTKISCSIGVVDKKPVVKLNKMFEELKNIESVSIEECNE